MTNIWVEMSGQTKVSNLEATRVIYKDVGKGHVPVNDGVGLKVQHPLYNLAKILPCCGEKRVNG